MKKVVKSPQFSIVHAPTEPVSEKVWTKKSLYFWNQDLSIHHFGKLCIVPCLDIWVSQAQFEALYRLQRSWYNWLSASATRAVGIIAIVFRSGMHWGRRIRDMVPHQPTKALSCPTNRGKSLDLDQGGWPVCFVSALCMHLRLVQTAWT